MLFTAMALAAAPPLAEQRAIFVAAGFVPSGDQWRTKDCMGLEGASYSPGAIETYKDLNGDGRPEAIVTEGSAICYGNTGTHFWLVSQQANGSWKRMVDETAMPEFASTKGTGGWPDIVLGGPGFCFPVLRWNGSEFVIARHQYEGKACKR
jgi:hypothetical protein